MEDTSVFKTRFEIEGQRPYNRVGNFSKLNS